MEEVSILNWNIRGINNQTAKHNLTQLIKETMPMFVFLQEKKCDNLHEDVRDKIWSPKDHSWLFSPASGLSGGLISTWNHSFFSIESSNVKKSWIWIRGRLGGSSELIICINIYGPHDLQDKLAIWKELEQVLDSHHQEAFCIMGDFNCIFSSKERVNCLYRRQDMSHFRSS